MISPLTNVLNVTNVTDMAIMAADKMFRKASISEFSHLSDISATVSRDIKEIASMDIRMTRTRAMLRDALEKLLDEKSFEDISVSEICELSTVRRATFYRHFKDKNDFYEWFLQTMTDQFLAEAGEADEVGSLEEYTRYMHRKLIEFSLENHGLFITESCKWNPINQLLSPWMLYFQYCMEKTEKTAPCRD